MATSRARVVSSFTLVKGSLIEETYTAFQAWDTSQSKKENLDRLKAANAFGSGSATWQRDVAKVLNRRFEPATRDLPLVELAKGGCAMELWKPILLWHMTRDEFLLRDFLATWLFRQWEEGAYRIHSEDLEPYLKGLGKRKVSVSEEWSETTLKRVASGLLRIATDFGLLRGTQAREFVQYHLPDDALLYLILAMTAGRRSTRRAIDSDDWRMYLMDSADLERELLRLHQYGALEYQVAGSVVHLRLPHASPLEYVRSLTA